jgi:hypothetical protein
LRVVHPEATDRTITGRLCGAIGSPYIQLQSSVMTACGMNFWQSRINSGNLDAEFWLSGYDPQTGLWSKWTGWLERPRFSRVQIGTNNVNTLYFDVEITLSQAVSAS